MFDKEYQFYPTPAILARKLIEPFMELKDDALILDPSAGKGDILKWIDDNSKYSRNNYTYHCCEIQPELQAILRENYHVVGSNFLDFDQGYFYDYIIMNPPFKDGATHLLHAIKISRDTKIACILNAETIRNPYTKERQLLLKKIEDHGSYEFHESSFMDAERKTKVEVALVWLDIKTEESNFTFDFKDSQEINFDLDFNPESSTDIANIDLIDDLNKRYDEILDSYIEFMKAEASYKHHLDMMYHGSRIDIKDLELSRSSPEKRYNHVAVRLKQYMWHKVIGHLDLQKYMSYNVKKNFDTFIKQHSHMAFTRNNITDFFYMILNNRKNIWDQAVVDVFEELTKYTHENRHHVEGWRTNDRFKINRKIILPSGCKYGEYMDSYALKERGDTFSCYWDNSLYTDLDSVLDYITGNKTLYPETVGGTLKTKFHYLGHVRTGDKFDNTCQSKYFDIRFYKKGTVHLTFRDKKVWDEFNMTACAGLNWLPDNEKTEWENKKKAKREAEKKQQVKPEPLMLEEQKIDNNNQITLF